MKSSYFLALVPATIFLAMSLSDFTMLSFGWSPLFGNYQPTYEKAIACAVISIAFSSLASAVVLLAKSAEEE